MILAISMRIIFRCFNLIIQNLFKIIYSSADSFLSKYFLSIFLLIHDHTTNEGDPKNLMIYLIFLRNIFNILRCKTTKLSTYKIFP